MHHKSPKDRENISKDVEFWGKISTIVKQKNHTRLAGVIFLISVSCALFRAIACAEGFYISCESDGGTAPLISISPQRSAIDEMTCCNTSGSFSVTNRIRVSLKFGNPLK